MKKKLPGLMVRLCALLLLQSVNGGVQPWKPSQGLPGEAGTGTTRPPCVEDVDEEHDNVRRRGVENRRMRSRLAP
jgi:hypothetical protein